MDANLDLAVTLSPELFEHLHDEAELLGVPLEWVVASLVVDTMDDGPDAVLESELVC
jgi:hypothetical protein